MTGIIKRFYYAGRNCGGLFGSGKYFLLKKNMKIGLSKRKWS